MDPYKVLNISEHKVKNPSDLSAVRKRAKDLFKRLGKEGKKFDAKKVLEAFEMVRQKLKNRPGEGQYKFLGRSRKERELDKHFNHQTKEIKKDKKIKHTLKRSARGEKRFRLPGEKERVARPRRREWAREKRRKKRELAMKRANVDVLEGLQRLAAVLPSATKFPKVIKLLHRWMKEYMNLDNRGFVFAVLDGVAACDFITEDPGARQDVIMVFEYVLGYFTAWFDQNEANKMLSKSWHLAAVQSCQCYTDDPFILSSTIVKLNDVLALLETNESVMDEWMAKDAERKAKAEVKAEEERKRVKTEAEVKGEVKDEKKPLIAKPLLGMAAPVRSPSPEKTPAPLASPASSDSAEEILSDDDDMDAFLIDSDDGDESDIMSIDSAEEVKDEIDIDSESDSGASDDDDDEVYIVPEVGFSLNRMRALFVDRCMATLFKQRAPLWARPKIDAFFQEVFYKRKVFTPDQQTQVEAWQARIKTMQKFAESAVGEANSNPLEANRPIVDSREMITMIDADSNSWAAKQTFDSRDKNGARGVIR